MGIRGLQGVDFRASDNNDRNVNAPVRVYQSTSLKELGSGLEIIQNDHIRP